MIKVSVITDDFAFQIPYDVNLTVTNSAGSNTMVKEALVTLDKPIGAPEFPVVAFPAALIVGMPGAVFLIRSTKEY